MDAQTNQAFTAPTNNQSALNEELFGYIDRSLQKFMEAGFYRKSQDHLNRIDYMPVRNDIATNFTGRLNYNMDQQVH